MTKAQLKEKYLEWNKKIGKAYFEDKTLNALQDLCVEYGDGKRWCSYRRCLEEIIKGGNAMAISRAFGLYETNNKNEAQMDAMKDLAIATKNFEIRGGQRHDIQGI